MTTHVLDEKNHITDGDCTEYSCATSITEHELSRTTTAILALCGAVLMGLTAHFEILLPGTPVPITLQTLMLLLGGFVLPHFGGAQMLGWYVVLGAAGLPFFAGGSAGMRVLTGPTAGYILGFVVAAIYLAFVRKKSHTSATFFLHGLIAHCIAYLFGIAGLSLILKVSLKQAVALGVAPFVIGDIYKTVAAVTLLKVSGKLLHPKK